MSLLVECLHTNRLQDLLPKVLILLHGLPLFRARISDPNLGPLDLEVVLGLQDALKLFARLWHTVDFNGIYSLGDSDD